MKYIFNDLLFDNEHIEIDSNDVESITQLGEITYF